MRIRKLFAVLVALAVLIAPGVTSAAMASARHDGMQMTAAGQCQTPPSHSGNHDKMGGKSCCIAMCMAVAVTPAARGEAAPVRQQIAEFALPKAYHGLHKEIATPPPRTA